MCSLCSIPFIHNDFICSCSGCHKSVCHVKCFRLQPNTPQRWRCQHCNQCIHGFLYTNIYHRLTSMLTRYITRIERLVTGKQK